MNEDFEQEYFHKRSVSLHGHKTSISLEQDFWNVLEDAAFSQNISLIQLIQKVDERRKRALSSALRLYALKYALGQKV
ncbi:MAG: ribbon-helix-helix domain-containing protein [Proteobacteria bacterium]|nr:ribbon-helix-helix domain-containing protein [Pseudomonadota bacterium]